MSPSLYSVSSTPSLRARASFSARKTCGLSPIVSHVLMFSSSRADGPTSRLMLWARTPAGSFKTSSAPAAATSESAPAGSSPQPSTIGVSACVNTRTLTGDQEMPGIGIRSMADRGPGTVQIELTAEGRSIFGGCSAPIDISFSGGPIFLGPKGGDLPLTIPLAHYSTEVSNYAPQRGTMIGTPAIFASRFGAGRVVAISPHPESTNGAEFLVKLAVLATARTRAAD